MKPNALVTGANRGIGLELVKQLKQKGYQVWAVCRTASDELRKLDVHIIDGVDVTNESELQKMVQQIPDHSLDVVINNAGILEEDRFFDFQVDDLLAQFKVNAVGPLLVTKSLHKKMKSPSKIAMITSRMGSIADNTSGSYYGYRASKAALNAFAKSLSIDLKADKIAIGILHPGFVQTDMTNHNGDRTPENSAANLLKRVDELSLANTGTFWHCDGEKLPW